eukprot:1623616-Prymnesium_polylepis.1
MLGGAAPQSSGSPAGLLARLRHRKMADKIQSFAVSFDKQAYFAGETLRARVTLKTTGPITCRGVRADIKGKGYCRFTSGSGDNKETHTHAVDYWRETHTLWGPFHRTEEIDEAGENAIFGSPWSPNEGVMQIPITSRNPLIVRVMDEDFGKRDDLLGEVVVNPEKLVADSQGGAVEVTLPLARKGSPEVPKGKPSVLVVRASWTQNAAGQQTLYLRSCRALNLRKADWGFNAKNDVYVQ